MARSPQSRPPTELEWWQQLGLRTPGSPHCNSPGHRRRAQAHADLLAEFAPPWFESSLNGGERVSAAELREKLDQARHQADAAFEARSTTRRKRGWTGIREAFEATDADELITAGVWAGFTRARAIAWSWNLTQYEPCPKPGKFGFRLWDTEDSIDGGSPPEEAEYAARARALEAATMTPQSYRIAQEAIGTDLFDPEVARDLACTCRGY